MFKNFIIAGFMISLAGCTLIKDGVSVIPSVKKEKQEDGNKKEVTNTTTLPSDQKKEENGKEKYDDEVDPYRVLRD